REPLYEEIHVDCCTAPGSVAGRGAVSTTAAGCRRPDKHIVATKYRRYLHRVNARYVLQCTHQPEPWWLWFKRLCWIKCQIGLGRWVRGDRPQWHRRAVGSYSDLLAISTGQRVVQLTKTKSKCGRNFRSL